MKLIIQFPQWLFQVYGTRNATPEERVAFNFVRNLPPSIITDDRLEKKARKIGKFAEWLDKSDDNLLSPQNSEDTYDQICPGLRVNEKIDSKLLVLRGNNTTVLIMEGCENALFIFRLLNLYSTKVVGIGGYIVRQKFAYASLFDIWNLTRICGSWHVGVEQVALLALDLELKERATIFGGKPGRKKQEGIDKYFGGGTYSIGRDFALVELSCSSDITGRVRPGSSRTVGNVWNNLRLNNPRRRVTVVQKFGSTASAYPETDNADYTNVFAFTPEITRRPEEYGFGPYAKLQQIPMDDEFRDATLKVSQDAVDFFGDTRVLIILSSVATSSGYPDCLITERCALIVVTRIVLVPGVRRGYTTDLFPYVAMLVLANSYGLVIAFNAVMDRGCVPPAGHQNLPFGIRKDCRYMWNCLLEYLRCSKVLVGFNISWILTALQLTVDATRVVDIGLEPSYQRWCGQLTQRARQYSDLLVQNLRVPYDSRWPAILYGYSMELSVNGRDDSFRDTYYTAAM